MDIINVLKGFGVGVWVTLASWLGVTPEKVVGQDPVAPTENLGAYNVTGGGTYRLKSSIGTTDSTINLSTFKEPVSEIPYSMGQLNTTIAYGTIDPQTTRSEFVSFTGITQNANGSAVLTGVTRGLTRSPAGLGCTASTTLAQRHPGQAVFILSDSPCHFAEYAVKRNDEIIPGQWSFPYPSASSSVASKGYVDSIVFSGSTIVDRLVVAGTAGETFNTGAIVFLDRFQEEWMKADADFASTTEEVLLGIAQGSGTNGISISGGVLLQGVDSNQGTTLIPSQRLYVSATAGATSTSPGTVVKPIGSARSASVFYFDPKIGTNNIANSTTTNATTTNSYVSGTSTIGSLNVASLGKNVQVCTSNCTWTKAVGVTKIKVTLVAGGGSGGSPAAPGGGLFRDGSGGAAGGQCIKWLDVTGTSTVNVLVGVGGATTTAGVIGLTGSSTVFGSFASTTGGTGGNIVQERPGGAGGQAFGCDFSITGQNGGWTAAFSSTSTPTGAGGGTMFGPGGLPYNGSLGDGMPGAGKGSGGSGGKANSGNGAVGGKGADGVAIIEW